MPEDNQSFATTRARLDEIVSQVRKKDTSLEKSLDLLEEGVRLANQCTELIDHADWEFASGGNAEASDSDSSEAGGDDASSPGHTEEEDPVGAVGADGASSHDPEGPEAGDADMADVDTDAESDNEDA